MNLSRGILYFHRLFSVQELGFGKNPEPFIGTLIRRFLRIGEAVAGRWIEMPHAILLFQMVPGVPDSGAIYLYDRRQHVFYMLCFEGPDDHITLEEFDHLLSEYNLLRFAEKPGLINRHVAAPVTPSPQLISAADQRLFAPEPRVPQAADWRIAFDLILDGYTRLLAGHARCPLPNLKHTWFQTAGSA